VFVEPEHSLLDRLAPRQGVLSQNLGQHPEHLPATDPPALNQTDHHPHMLEYHRVGLDRASFGNGGLGKARGPPRRPSRPGLAALARREATAPLIVLFLNLFPILVAVIGAAAPNGLSPSMLWPATKGAPDQTALFPVARVS